MIGVLDYWKNDTNMRSIFEINESKGVQYIGSRKMWEQNLFGDLYEKSQAIDRPKYGTLNLTNNISGVPACTRYGDSFVIYREHMRNRITFVFGDTCKMQNHIATLQGFCHILYYVENKLLKEMIDISNGTIKSSTMNYSPYLDIQIHGPIIINDDFESLNIPLKHKNNKGFMENLQEFNHTHSKVKINFF